MPVHYSGKLKVGVVCPHTGAGKSTRLYDSDSGSTLSPQPSVHRSLMLLAPPMHSSWTPKMIPPAHLESLQPTSARALLARATFMPP